MRYLKQLYLLLLVILLFSCGKKDTKGIIPASKMIPILEDIHVTDAMLLNENITRGDEKALGYYKYIYEKHQITKEAFDNSMDYYAQKPKKLRQAYSDILSSLAKRDSILKKEQSERIDTLQLWDGKSYYLVEKYTSETIPVEIPVDYQKVYHISAEIKIYNDSQFKEVSPYFAFISPDSTYVLPTQKITADTIYQEFKIKQMVTDSTITLLKGDFLPTEKKAEEQFKHYEIKNIQIYTTDLDSINENALSFEKDSILIEQK